MMFIENVDKDKYENFVKNHSSKSHFLQSYEWGEFSKENKTVTPYYTALMDDKKNIVATALLLQRKMPFGFSYFYCPRGFVCDYSNKDVIKELTLEIKKFAKRKKALFLKIDPDVKLQQLDIDGNVLDGNNNYELVSYLKSIGYKHLGYNKSYIAFGIDLLNTPADKTWAVNYNNGIYQYVKGDYIIQFDGTDIKAAYNYKTDWMMTRNLTSEASLQDTFKHMTQELKAIIQSYMQRMENNALR